MERPEKCKCDIGAWPEEDYNPICDEFLDNAHVTGFAYCGTCEHDYECHE